MRHLIYVVVGAGVVFVAFLIAGGCSSSRVVHVVDATGVPVAGASVEAVSLSINVGPTVTNAAGEAVLPRNVQGTKWIVVSKDGYDRVELDMPSSWPMRVILRRPETR